MAEEMENRVRKRKPRDGDGKFNKHRKGKKSKRLVSGKEDVRVKKMDKKTKRFFQKRARDYDSGNDDDDNDEKEEEEEKAQGIKEGIVLKDERKGGLGRNFSEDEEDGNEDSTEQNEVSEDEDGEIQPGVLKLSEGCKAFRLAFKKITKKTSSTDDDILGPVLSAHKKLVAEKLAEEDTERKVKSESKKEKHLVGEKGHMKPANYLDSQEKFLIGVATRGVVKLFNAVNKAQHAQKGLNPTRSKDEKVIKKRRKETFLSALGQASSKQAGTLSKVDSSSGAGSTDAPAWAPLRDNYMLANSKLKDWDKMQDTSTAAEDEFGLPAGADSSSDDE